MSPSAFALTALLACLALARPSRADCLELLVPAYQYPAVGAMWNDLATPAPWGRVNVIVNPNSGPGAGVDPNYLLAVQQARAAGARLFAYVYTSYAARPSAAVLADVAAFQSFYAPLDGVFLDEMDNQPASLAYYQDLRSQIRTLIPSAVVIGNPGTSVPESFVSQDAADVIVTYENNAASPSDPYATATPPAWTLNYPAGRFAHIIYNVPDAAAMRSTLALAASRRVAMVYVTDDVLPNPYDTLPQYWSLETRLCFADFNCSGAVSVQDVFDFLAAWFAQSPRADINAVGAVSVQDIFDFLAAWFAGC